MEGNNLLEADVYGAAFKQTQAGEQVLTELMMLFYDIESFDRDNQYMTAYNEGQRSVIRYIIQKIMIAETKNNNNNKMEK